MELQKKVARPVGIFYNLGTRYHKILLELCIMILIHPFYTISYYNIGLNISHILGSCTEIAERFLRIIIFGDPVDHSYPLFIRFAILKVQDLHKLQ